MPLVPNFSASQTIGQNSTINLSDISTGSDVAITDREVFITDAFNNYITANGSFTTPTGTDWAIANGSIAIDCLKQDTATQITVNWLDVMGNVLYTKSLLFVFTLYGVTGSFLLSQSLSSQPSLLQDSSYWLQRIILRCNIEDGKDAVDLMANIFTSQAALDREAYQLANLSNYFYGS